VTSPKALPPPLASHQEGYAFYEVFASVGLIQNLKGLKVTHENDSHMALHFTARLPPSSGEAKKRSCIHHQSRPMWPPCITFFMTAPKRQEQRQPCIKRRNQLSNAVPTPTHSPGELGSTRPCGAYSPKPFAPYFSRTCTLALRAVMPHSRGSSKHRRLWTWAAMCWSWEGARTSSGSPCGGFPRRPLLGRLRSRGPGQCLPPRSCRCLPGCGPERRCA